MDKAKDSSELTDQFAEKIKNIQNQYTLLKGDLITIQIRINKLPLNVNTVGDKLCILSAFIKILNTAKTAFEIDIKNRLDQE